jgi:hypothetical protein
MAFHRWWLALIGLLLTPWIGPHVDRYLPLGWLLVQAADGSADAAFWVVASILAAAGYGVWFLVLTLLAKALARARRVPGAVDRG